MGIFVLRLLVVPHLLFPFFKYCFSSFLTKMFTSNKMQLKSFFTFGGKTFQWKKILAELAGIFVEYSFKFISRLKAYDKISKRN